MTAAAEARLTASLASHYPETVSSPRRIGREIEIPVVDSEGLASEVAGLWPALLDLPGSIAVHDEDTTLLVGVERPYGLVSVEFGRGVIEVALRPENDLPQLQASADIALAELRAAALPAGAHLLGLGLQPRTTATPAQMTPKKRYWSLVDAVGPPALRWTGTAADQVHIDVARDELIPALNVVNGLAGALIAISANSPFYAGRASSTVAGREAQAMSIFDQPHRWGATPDRLSSIEDYVRYVLSFPPIGPTPDGDDDWERFVALDHLVWPNGRAVFRFGTVEVRPACQQPFSSFWAPSAISLGLVENAPLIDAWLKDRVEWEQLLDYRMRAIRKGLRAEQPFPGFLREVLELAEAGLTQRGLGEESYMEDAWERLERGRCPADDALDLVAAQGFDGLVRARSL